MIIQYKDGWMTLAACTSGIHQLLIQLFRIQLVFGFCFTFYCARRIKKHDRKLNFEWWNLNMFIKCTKVRPCVPAFFDVVTSTLFSKKWKENPKNWRIVTSIVCSLCIWMHLSANGGIDRFFCWTFNVHVIHFAWFIRKLNLIHSFVVFPFIRTLSHWTLNIESWNLIIII